MSGQRQWKPSTNFNPILVRFKLTIRKKNGTFVHSFQSYFSPIQTHGIVDWRHHNEEFQSYFSPIQTSTSDSLPRAVFIFQSYFSPIQTSHTWRTWCDRRNHFNPILVRFKPPERSDRGPGQPPFQSYFSPIQTNSPDTAVVMSSHFNPILVRFKPGPTPAHCMPRQTFQSYFSPIQTTLPLSLPIPLPQISILF